MRYCLNVVLYWIGHIFDLFNEIRKRDNINYQASVTPRNEQLVYSPSLNIGLLSFTVRGHP